ncbi:MAG: hypothetical protein M0Z64_04605 [Nitrospiraceae bacterium]|nr:hypothetical protein [Nitrospiraceae bacterium]
MAELFLRYYDKINRGGVMAQTLKPDKKIHIPPELLWDYKEPPDDILWRLQRIADFFPQYGAERETVELLFEYRDKLKLEEGKYKLIALYKEVWDEKAAKGHTK